MACRVLASARSYQGIDWHFPSAASPEHPFFTLAAAAPAMDAKGNGDTFCLIQHNKIAPLYYKTNTNGCP